MEGNWVQVAVKVVKTEAEEVQRVKLLQEAAIMGQFAHPNVVRLHGVVTVGDPVSLLHHCCSYHVNYHKISM